MTTYEQASAVPLDMSFFLTKGGELYGLALVSRYSREILYCETDEGEPIELTQEERKQAQAIVDSRYGLGREDEVV